MPRISSRQLDLIEGEKAEHRVRGGRTAQRVGLGFEKQLAAQHDAYRVERYARLARNELPTAPAGKSAKGGLLRRVSGPARWDYEGVLGPASPWPGRHVVIEAKHTSKRPKTVAAKLPVRDKGGMKRAQLEALVELHRDFHSVVALVWECVGEVGFMGGPALEAFRGKLVRGGPEAIDETCFDWLPAGSLDYLRPVVNSLEAFGTR